MKDANLLPCVDSLDRMVVSVLQFTKGHCFSQWLCVPFALMCPAVVDITETAYNFTFQSPWVGTLEADRAWRWIDNFLLLVSVEGFL